MDKPVNKYLEMQIKTSSKEQLLLMLFDGAIKFAEQSTAKISEKDYEASHNLLIKAQRIVMELITALDKKNIEPAIYKNLIGLYTFIYLRLVEANIKKDTKLIDEALKVLNSLRTTWAEAIAKMHSDSRPQIEITSNIPGETDKNGKGVSVHI